MSNPIPPSLLIFAPFDPSGAGHLPADALTLAALGGHPLSVATAIYVQDTMGMENLEPLSPELVDDQARCLLEDMTVHAIKVGPVCELETLQMVAQIAADYSQLPLLLQLEALPNHPAAQEADDTLAATLELLLPQADVVMVSHRLLAHWQAEGYLPRQGGDDPARWLLSGGADWALVLDAPIRPGHNAHVLYGPEQAMANWPASNRPASGPHAHSPLACAIGLGLAQGLAPQAAVEQAMKLAAPLAERWFQPGMGHKILLRTAP